MDAQEIDAGEFSVSPEEADLPVERGRAWRTGTVASDTVG
jgi:hypothetical protein